MVLLRLWTGIRVLGTLQVVAFIGRWRMRMHWTFLARQSGLFELFYVFLFVFVGLVSCVGDWSCVVVDLERSICVVIVLMFVYGGPQLIGRR